MLVLWFISTPHYKGKSLFRSYMPSVPGDTNKMIPYSTVLLWICHRDFSSEHSTVDWTSSSKKVLLYTWNSLNVSYKWNPNLHIPYFWSEFPGRNLTHPAANVYEMCLYACMEVPLVSRYNGRSPSRLHVPTLLCILTDLLWDVQKM